MSGKNPTINISSSPPSAGTRTYDGSPSTNPTIMSPDCGNGVERPDSPVTLFRLAGSTAHIGLGAHRNLTVPQVPSVTVPQRLSPTAEDFTPSALTTTFAGPQTNARIGSGVGTKPGILATSPVRSLVLDSDPDDTPSTSPSYSSGGLTFTLQAGPGIIGQPARPTQYTVRSTPVQGPPQLVVNFGTFTVDERVSRAFVVYGLNPASASQKYEYIASCYRNFKSLVNINARSLRQGAFALQFNDIEDAKQALVLTQTFLFRDGPVECVKQTPKELAYASGTNPDTVTNHQAEYIIHVVDLGGSKMPIDARAVLDACLDCGRVKAFKTHMADARAVMSFRVEFYDTRTDATQLSGSLLCGYRLCIELYAPDVIRVASRQPDPLDDPAHLAAVMGYYRPTRSSAILSPGVNHNIVDIMKIMLGQDVRTTIMLRNIPNRVDQEALKNLLDETSKGEYDFMYLRIDFANNCNVGYAFINFVDPMAIVPFAKARAGQKWNLFHSDKVAEISYATIQGRDCLVQKFRNSSVMCERPAFRPKLYKTGDGPDAGREELFPPPDNESKLRRSLDNAETVGLYKPNPSALNGPSSSLLDTTIPPPKNQAPGGAYEAPSASRVAVGFNSSANDFASQPPREDIPVIRSPSPSRVAHAVDFFVNGLSSRPIRENSSFTKPPSPSLYAPREGQAYRERQRRQLSRFDRGTPGAESELAIMTSRFAVAGLNMTRPDSVPAIGGVSLRPGNHMFDQFVPTPRQSVPVASNPNFKVANFHPSFPRNGLDD